MVLKVKAMKTMNRMFWAIAAAVVAVACAKEAEPSHVQESDGLVPMTFSASAEGEIQTKTTYSGRKVYWEAEDEISVFSIGTQVVKTGFKATSVSEDGTLASFSGVAAPGAENYVAVYPHQEANAFDLATQTLTVNIPTDQVGVGNGFASGANVSVAHSIAAGTAAEGEEEPAQEESLKFRNVGAMFCFKFETEEDAAATKSVTFRAKKSDTEFWGLTGIASVNFDTQTGLPSATEGSVDHVTLVAPDEGFKAGPVYYLPVYPVGACTGMEITFTDVNEKTWVKNNDLAAELKRNCLLNIGSVPDVYDTLPEEITISLDFLNDANVNPLGTFPKMADQSNSGTDFNYTYSYEYEGKAMTKDFVFAMYKGAGYAYTYLGGKTENAPTKYLYIVKSATSCIKLPAIPGRYLKKVSCSHTGTTYARNFRLQEGYPSAGHYYSASAAPAAATEIGTAEINIPTGTTNTAQLNTTKKGTAYYIQFTSNADYNITNITVVYTKNKPE